jgi:transposase
VNPHIRVLGIDIATPVCHLVGLDDRGTVVWRTRLYRAQLMAFITTLPPAVLGMEACGGAHDWARRGRGHGPEVHLMPPPLVTPYVKAHQNDRRDAEAIAEAVTRPTRRFGPIKSVAQQAIQARHRVRIRLLQARTALIHETRGLLHEVGIVVPPGALTFRQHLLAPLAANDAQLTPMSQALCQPLEAELAALEDRLAHNDAQLTRLARRHPVCQRLMTMPGLGELTATALVAAVRDAAPFKNGRQFADWLGVVPRQHSTGGKSRLLGISQRGDMSRRTLLVHRARSCLRWVDRPRDRRSQWAWSLLERRGWKRAAVALAHKNAWGAGVLRRTDQAYCAADV